MEETTIRKFSDFGIKPERKRFVGEKIKLAKILNTEIMIHWYQIMPSRYPERGSDTCLWMQISVDGTKRVAFSIAKVLMEEIQKVPVDHFPFTTKIINDNDIYEFT